MTKDSVRSVSSGTVTRGGNTNTKYPILSAPPQGWFWVILGLVSLGGVYLLRGVLLPFFAGAAVAYFLDPVADWLERRGASRMVATIFITALFLFFCGAALLFLVPAVQSQIVHFMDRLPGYVYALEDRIEPFVAHTRALLPMGQGERLRDGVMEMVGNLTSWATSGSVILIKSVLTSSLVLINVASLLVITPVVTFYLLRDWDHIIGMVDGWLPRRQAQTIRTMAAQIDEMLAGFVRGQATVCLILGSFYAIALSLVGLDLGLVVGLGAGVASVVPYVGTIGGFLVSVGLAFAQFSDSWSVALVGGIFIVGQFFEGYVLSPFLVGERVGLHPVWLIFSLLAGGALFGFAGILLAVPSAAVIGVLARHFLSQYLESALYHGGKTGLDEDGPTEE